MPYEYISVLGEENKEVGIIYDVNDFDDDTVTLLKREIDRKYYSPVIKEIRSVKERYGFSYWKALTDDEREIDFTMQDTFKNMLHVGDDCVALVDVDGNRYIIKSISALSAKSYRKIELYL